MATSNLTADQLRNLLHYDPDTGIFTRRQASGTAKAGDVAGWIEPHGYRKISIAGRKHYAHRCAVLYMTGAWPDKHIDHIDGNPLNNSYSNLRCVSQQINTQNLRGPRSDNKTGVLGVRYHRAAKKFMAEIKDADGMRHYLGLHKTKDQAEAAYLDAKRKIHQGCTI